MAGRRNIRTRELDADEALEKVRELESKGRDRNAASHNTTRQVTQVHGQFREWTQSLKQAWPVMETMSEHGLQEIYVTHLMDLDRRLTTIKTYRQIMKRYHFQLDNAEEVETRIAEAHSNTIFDNSVVIDHASRTPKIEVPLQVMTSLLNPTSVSTTSRCQEKYWSSGAEKCLELRSMWFCAICTGGRPADIMRAQLSPCGEGLHVKWGLRKQRKGGMTALMYKYEWSVKPPKDILQRLLGLEKSPWKIPCASAAGSLNEWMSREQRIRELDHFSPGCARTRMSSHLLSLVDECRLSPDDFAILMDHSAVTSEQSYNARERKLVRPK